MPFNGVGTFTRIYSWVTDAANGILVRADRTDTDSNDIASGLSNCMTRDGQSPATAAIPMGSQKITGLANGVAAQDATTVLQVFTAPTFVGPVTVSSGGIAVTGNSTITGTLGSLTGLSSSGTVSFTAGTTTVATATALTNSTVAASTAYSDTAIAVETAARVAADLLKAPIASPTFTGTVTIPGGASISGFATLASPTFTGVPAAPTATAGDSSTQLATTAFVATQAFSTALPLQTGNSGKVVTTNGTTASWTLIGTASQSIRVNAGGTALEGYVPLVPTGSVIYSALTQGAF